MPYQNVSPFANLLHEKWNIVVAFLLMMEVEYISYVLKPFIVPFAYILTSVGNSLAIQWLGLHALTAKGPGSIPGWGTKIPQVMWCGHIYIHTHTHIYILNLYFSQVVSPVLLVSSLKILDF